MFTTRGYMKRLGNTFEIICDRDTLIEAHYRAKKGKGWYRDVQAVDKDLDNHIDRLQESLLKGTYLTGKYTVKTIIDKGKERVIHILPYYPDRIVHHAIMIACGERWESALIRDTYQSIQKRGTSDAYRRVCKHLKKEEPLYYLQMDVQKFYPSIDNLQMKAVMRRYIKCPSTLKLLDEIIDSTEGLPIGNYLSQILGNLYLAEFDWWIKQELKIKGYFRYCDDLVITGNCKDELHQIRLLCEEKLAHIGLKIKPSWKVSDFKYTGLDFVGIVFRTDSIRLRDSIKVNLCKTKAPRSIVSYYGWTLKLPRNNIWYHKMFYSNYQLSTEMSRLSRGSK